MKVRKLKYTARGGFTQRKIKEKISRFKNISQILINTSKIRKKCIKMEDAENLKQSKTRRMWVKRVAKKRGNQPSQPAADVMRGERVRHPTLSIPSVSCTAAIDRKKEMMMKETMVVCVRSFSDALETSQRLRPFLSRVVLMR